MRYLQNIRALKKSSGGVFGKINLENLAKNLNFFDRWVLSHYKYLPTDNRYRELSDETKELLFYIYIHTPTDTDCLQQIKDDFNDRDNIAPSDSDKKAAEALGIDLENAINDITGFREEKKEKDG